MSSGTGRAAALDVGFKRIGVAISDPLRITVRPYRIILRKDNASTFNEIREMIEREGVTTLVIGLPLTSSGEETTMSDKVRKFSRKLQNFLKREGVSVEVIFQNEYLSTEEAVQLCREIGKDGEKVDDVAAALILRDYLRGKDEGKAQGVG